jgi:hypothetical protein
MLARFLTLLSMSDWLAPRLQATAVSAAHHRKFL